MQGYKHILINNSYFVGGNNEYSTLEKDWVRTVRSLIWTVGLWGKFVEKPSKSISKYCFFFVDEEKRGNTLPRCSIFLFSFLLQQKWRKICTMVESLFPHSSGCLQRLKAASSSSSLSSSTVIFFSLKCAPPRS